MSSLRAAIHRSAWKGRSANFACTGFSEASSTRVASFEGPVRSSSKLGTIHRTFIAGYITLRLGFGEETRKQR